jgi:hypothetical protein
MLENVKLYQSYQIEVSGKEIDEPRPEAREYLERVEYEKQLLGFVYEKFGGKLIVETPKRHVAEAELVSINNLNSNSYFFNLISHFF